MKRLVLGAIICLLALFAVERAQSKVRLPRLVSDGMVLQRDTPLKVWGWASSGETVEVVFRGETYKTRADKKGDWSIEMSSLPAGGPYAMRVNGIEIKDILIGDVWLCSGQSNMELPVRRTLDLYAGEVGDARNPFIRYFRVPMKYSFGHEDTDLESGEWKSVTPENILDFSAASYFFADDLYRTYGVPVGIINNAIGGSPAEAWIGRESLKNFPHYINEADECAAPGYVEYTMKADNAKGRAWYESLQDNDPGLSVWQSEDLEDSRWETVSLPGYWVEKGIKPASGTIWLRKEVEVPSSMVGKEGVIRLGCIVDADQTYINGTFVGNITYQYPPRIYSIPAGVLKEGRNVVAVRVTDNSGRGGFVPDKPYKIIVGDEAIDISGDWKYSIGAQVDPPQPQTTFQYKPTGLYNGMLAPLKNFALKGFLWYQGESNTGRAHEYRDLMSELVNGWRKLWNSPRMPFIFAQLPGLGRVTEKYRSESLKMESGWAELREAQRLTITIPDTGMTVTIDVGEWNDIHPIDKKTVARRLALEARRVAYGETDIVSSGPIYESMTVRDGSAILTFSSTGSGIYTDLDLNGFAIAGRDKKYVWANATVLVGNKIRVWSNEVPEPVSVRYAWADNPEWANLKNKEGLPASPFRADLIITENATGMHDGYDWELWHDRGDVSMTLKTGGAFECSWNDINNVLFRTGRKFNPVVPLKDLGNVSISYGCDYRPVGNSYLCVYGWTVDPLVEFYVVEAWGDWRPPGAALKGTVEIDEGIYDIYETVRTDQPSIQGVVTFKQFWSVRRDKKTEGTVSLSKHFDEWRKREMKLGSMYEVAFCIEGFRSNGTADLYEHTMTIGDRVLGECDTEADANRN